MFLRSGRIVGNNSDLHTQSSLAELLESASSEFSAHMDPALPPPHVLPEGSVQGENDQIDQNILRPLREYLYPARQTTPSCIVLPIGHQNFNFKPGTIQLLPTFHGMDSENPYMHMKEFEDVCGTCMDRNVNEDMVRLKLFPFSLKDKAKMWLNSLEPRSIGTWRDMQTKFLKKYFPANRTVILQQQIMNFVCKSNETFAQAWERFRELLQACPHHGFESWRIVNFFHNALTPNLKMLVATMCNGEFYDKTAEEALHFFDSLAENTKQWEVVSPSFSDFFDSPQARSKFQLNEVDDLGARLAALSKKVELMEQKKQVVKEKEVNCVLCETSDHRTDDCPTLPAFKEVLYGQANPNPAARPFHSNQGMNTYGQGSNPYSNTYNPGYRNHPNLSWKAEAQNQQHQPQQPVPSQPFHSQPFQPQ